MRTQPKEQEALERIKNFEEVCLGYSDEEAILEAERCLQCKNPLCIQGCPVVINIPSFIKAIKEKENQKAIGIIKERNNLPAVCGRVCPQESQCELRCVLSVKADSINIGKLERYAADHEEKQESINVVKNRKKIVVIGSGPAGLTCAADLAKNGYSVTIFEALHETGGVLRYGIPEFRLPNKIVDVEIENIKKLGIIVELNIVVGKTISFNSLLDNFDAVFISVGAGLPNMMGIIGENLQNVYSANEFLTRINLMNAKKFPEYKTPIKKAKHTIVVGGGNVAIDSARVAIRLGSKVTLVYRRGEEEMPARTEEIQHAKEEGIKFELLTHPVLIVGEKKVEAIECVKMKLIEQDESGRKKPEQIPDSNYKIECDQVIIAIGQTPNPLLVQQLDLRINEKGIINVDSEGRTSNKKVWAAGDITTGASTVIQAMGDAKIAANSIDKYLNTK